MQGNLKNSLFNTDILKRIVIYSIMTLIFSSAQCAFFPILKICPMTPDIILAMLVAICLLDDSSSALICSVGAGFLVDAIGASGISLSPVIYCITIMIVGQFTHKMLKSFASFLLLLVPALICRALSTLLCIMIVQRSAPALWMFGEILVPEAICTAICAIPIYFLVKLCSKPLQSHSRFTF